MHSLALIIAHITVHAARASRRPMFEKSNDFAIQLLPCTLHRAPFCAQLFYMHALAANV